MNAFRIGACVALITATSQRAQSQAKPPSKPATLSAVVEAAPLTDSDSVTIRIAGTEMRAAVQIMQQYLDRPVIFTGSPGGAPVTFETPRPVLRADVPRLLRGLLESQGYELVADSASGTYRARLKEQLRAAVPVQQTPAFNPGAPPQTRQQSTPELFVIALKHARAADVASTINSLFQRAAPPVNGGPIQRTPGLTDDVRNAAPPAQEPTALGAPRSATLTGELTIVSDSRANSLLIRANRQDYDLILSVVQQIDVRPAQVLIEVLIVEARRDRSFAIGVSASAKDQHIGGTENSRIGGEFTPGKGGLGDFTLNVMGISGLDIDATITAAIGRGDVRVVSRPVVLTANDEQAEVVVGSQRPFVQVSRSLPTSDAVRDQVVQYKDVGTKLSVRPTISVDGTVQLHVSQEVSNATTETQFNAPVISTRSIRTDLLVKDGQTIVMGGLTDKQKDVESQGIPLLSAIPFIGGLFGRHARNTSETELFIFLTPRVIRTDEDAARLTDPLRKRAGKVEP
jgi:type II secretory pathway component GspD/PulD (secretin)